MTLKRYKNPTDASGQPYYVPCVSKNKDSLVYFIRGANMTIREIMMEFGIEHYKMNLKIDSLRFVDILPDGRRLSELNPNDYHRMSEENEKRKSEYHPDNANVKNTQNFFFTLTCPYCTNSYVFKSEDEIPNESFDCGLCNHRMIDYTHTNDWEFNIALKD